MDFKNIKIEYRDTPEKFRMAADEVVSYLVKNLLRLNAIEEHNFYPLASVISGKGASLCGKI